MAFIAPPHESLLDPKVKKKPKSRNMKWGHRRKTKKLQIQNPTLEIPSFETPSSSYNFQGDIHLAWEINSNILENIKIEDSIEIEQIVEPPTSKSSRLLLKEVRVILCRVDQDPRYTEFIEKILQNARLLDSSFEESKTIIEIDAEFETINKNFDQEDDEKTSGVSENELESHESLLKISPEPRKAIKCKYCSRFFSSEKLLQFHEGLHPIKHPIQLVTKLNKKLVSNRRIQFKPRVIFEKFSRQLKPNRSLRTTPHATSKDNYNMDLDGCIPSLRNTGVIEFETLQVSGDWSQLEELETKEYFVTDPLALETDEESRVVDLDHMAIKVDTTDVEDCNMEEKDPLHIYDKQYPNLTLDFTPDNIDPSVNLHDPVDPQFELTSNEIPSVMIRDEEMCQVSDVSYLLDLLDGPAPESATGNSESLTLNYEDGTKQLESYACVHCPKVFDSNAMLDDHAQNSHFARIKKPYICLQTNCSMRFVSSQSLQVHRTMVHSHRPNEVSFGGNSTDVTPDNCNTFDSTQINQRMELMIPGGTTKMPSTIVEPNEDSLLRPKHKCKTCGKKFKYLMHCVNHESRHLDNMSGTQRCRFCPKRFDDLDKYYKHVKYHVKLMSLGLNLRGEKSKTNNKWAKNSFQNIPHLPPIVCQHCCHKSTDLQTYVVHINEAHGLQPDAVNYSCPFPRCEKRMIRSLWNFRLHLGTHQKRIECLLCGLQFKGKMEFFKHKRLEHKTERLMNNIPELISANGNVQLPICTVPTPVSKKKLSQVCTTCSEEVDATTTHHICPKGDSSVFQCSLCRCSFSRMKDILTHLIRVHPKLPCRICTKGVFRTKIDIHLKSHMGETGYACNHCSLPYLTADSLKKHMSTKFHAAAVINMSERKIVPIDKSQEKCKNQGFIRKLDSFPREEGKIGRNGNLLVEANQHSNEEEGMMTTLLDNVEMSREFQDADTVDLSTSKYPMSAQVMSVAHQVFCSVCPLGSRRQTVRGTKSKKSSHSRKCYICREKGHEAKFCHILKARRLAKSSTGVQSPLT